MQSESEFLNYRKNEAHIIRRLGVAIVSLWNELPEVEHQVRALQVHDEYDTVGLNEQLRAFLAEYAGKRLMPPSGTKWPNRSG